MAAVLTDSERVPTREPIAVILRGARADHVERARAECGRHIDIDEQTRTARCEDDAAFGSSDRVAWCEAGGGFVAWIQGTAFRTWSVHELRAQLAHIGAQVDAQVFRNLGDGNPIGGTVLEPLGDAALDVVRGAGDVARGAGDLARALGNTARDFGGAAGGAAGTGLLGPLLFVVLFALAAVVVWWLLRNPAALFKAVT